MIANNDLFYGILLDAISSPSFNITLGFAGTIMGYLGIKGITFNKPHQFNPKLRSLISFPIAIQSKDKTPLNMQQIHDAVLSCCPNSQTHFQNTSSGLSIKKVEINVVDWKEYEEKDFEIVRNELHLKIIEAVTTNGAMSNEYQELEVLNFDIQRSQSGQIENVIPIENKIAKELLQIIDCFRFFIQKIWQSFLKTKIGRLFA
ncbi:MAG: hypothetical protein Tsb0021_17970 [Chlamydiales bacterium]